MKTDGREGETRRLVLLVLLLFFLLFAFPVSAQSWVSMNTDYDFNDPSEWVPATWGLAREGVDIFPEMTMAEGIATTTLNSYAGRDEWNSASYKQDKYEGSTFQIEPLTLESKVSYKVKPFYEKPGRCACFNIFVEVWIKFSEPVGIAKGTIAELMFKQRVITSPDVRSQPENSYTYAINQDAGFGDWYLITYRLPDVSFNEWTQHELSWNKYFYGKLEEFGIDLTKGHIYAVIFGVEGYSAGGGAGAQWDFVNCMTKDALSNRGTDEKVSTIFDTPEWTEYNSTSESTAVKNDVIYVNTPTLTPTPPLNSTVKPTSPQPQSPTPSISPTEKIIYQHKDATLKPQTSPSNVVTQQPTKFSDIANNTDSLKQTGYSIDSTTRLMIILIVALVVANIKKKLTDR